MRTDLGLLGRRLARRCRCCGAAGGCRRWRHAACRRCPRCRCAAPRCCYSLAHGPSRMCSSRSEVWGKGGEGGALGAAGSKTVRRCTEHSSSLYQRSPKSH